MQKQIHFAFQFPLPMSNGKLNDKLLANDFSIEKHLSTDLFAMQDLKCKGFHLPIVRLIVHHERRFVLEDFVNDQS